MKEVTKKTVAAAFMNAEQAEKDSQYLATCQMCIYAALKIGAECAKNVLQIIEKYNSKAPRLKVLTKSILQFAQNSSEGLAKLSDNGGVVDKSREQATALSAGNFISLYMTAVTIQPAQMEDFIRELDTLGLSYMKKPNAETFSFLVWLKNEGWKFDQARYWKDGSPFTLTFLRRNDTELVQISKGVEMPCYTGGIPQLEHEAETLFYLLKINNR